MGSLIFLCNGMGKIVGDMVLVDPPNGQKVLYWKIRIRIHGTFAQGYLCGGKKIDCAVFWLRFCVHGI